MESAFAKAARICSSITASRAASEARSYSSIRSRNSVNFWIASDLSAIDAASSMTFCEPKPELSYESVDPWACCAGVHECANRNVKHSRIPQSFLFHFRVKKRCTSISIKKLFGWLCEGSSGPQPICQIMTCY